MQCQTFPLALPHTCPARVTVHVPSVWWGQGAPDLKQEERTCAGWEAHEGPHWTYRSGRPWHWPREW